MPHQDKIQFLFSANNFGIAHFVHFCSLIVIGLPENLIAKPARLDSLFLHTYLCM